MSALKKLFCIGNPLLDVSAEVDQAFLDKYGVKLNNAILAEDQHLPVFEDLVANHKVQFIAGGATQNTARVAQWQINVPGAVTYTGCIGKDKFGEKLKEAAKADGLNTPYYEIEGTETGKCAVLVVGAERSLIAHLSAAEKYKIEWTQTPEIQGYIAAAEFYYIAGFVLTHSPDSIMHVAKHAHDHNKVFCMNTSAPFLFQVPPFLAAFKDAWEYIDILFGNESEAAVMGEAFGIKGSVSDIALAVGSPNALSIILNTHSCCFRACQHVPTAAIPPRSPFPTCNTPSPPAFSPWGRAGLADAQEERLAPPHRGHHPGRRRHHCGHGRLRPHLPGP